jgi:nucleotide-binding universal stress UspA family protein
MQTPLPPVVLAAIDASSAAPVVIEHAARLAKAMSGASVHVAHVIDSLPIAAATVGGSPLALPSAAHLLQLGREHLERHVDTLQQMGHEAFGHLLLGPTVKQVLQLCADLSCDVLVVGTHDPSRLERLLLGSVAEELARKAPCAVVIARRRRDDHADVPEIEPPCPDCVAVQQATRRAKIWCDRHAQRHPHGIDVASRDDSFGVGSMSFRP